MQTIYIDTNLSLPPSLISNNTLPEASKPAKLLPFQQYRKHYRTDDKLERANKPINATAKTSVAGDQAQKIVAIANEKLKGSRNEWFMSDTYLALVTGQKDRQNRNVISQINGTKFHVTRDRKRKGYVLAKLETENISWQYIAKSECPQPQETKRLEATPYKNNSSKRTRSIASVRGAKSCNNSFSDNQTQTVDKNEKVKIEQKSKILANATASELKETQQINQEISKAKVIKTRAERFGGYREPQTLGQMHKRLTPEICSKLRSISNREFSNNFIEQRVLAMSKKPELATRRFKYQKGFVFYMALALQHELHDSVQTGNIDFRLLANITAQDRFSQRQEKFLAEIENTRQVSPEWHFKKKLVSVLSSAKAYELLQAYTSLVMAESTLEIRLSRHVELTQLEKDLVLDQAKATHERMDAETMEMEVVNVVKFVVSESSNLAQLVGQGHKNQATEHQIPIKLPKGIWGEISQKIIDDLGVDSYRNWFSKVTAEVDEVAKTIALKAPSEFVKDWLVNNYQGMVERIIGMLGYKFMELEV
jgi:hypothetical protein